MIIALTSFRGSTIRTRPSAQPAASKMISGGSTNPSVSFLKGPVFTQPIISHPQFYPATAANPPRTSPRRKLLRNPSRQLTQKPLLKPSPPRKVSLPGRPGLNKSEDLYASANGSTTWELFFCADRFLKTPFGPAFRKRKIGKIASLFAAGLQNFMLNWLQLFRNEFATKPQLRDTI